MRALGNRGDASAIPALQALLKRDDLSIDMAPTVKQQIARLQKEESGKANGSEEGDTEKSGEGIEQAVTQRLDRLERLIQEMSDRLKSIESTLAKK
jgi:hypothetical protein